MPAGAKGTVVPVLTAWACAGLLAAELLAAGIRCPAWGSAAEPEAGILCPACGSWAVAVLVSQPEPATAVAWATQERRVNRGGEGGCCMRRWGRKPGLGMMHGGGDFAAGARSERAADCSFQLS